MCQADLAVTISMVTYVSLCFFSFKWEILKVFSLKNLDLTLTCKKITQRVWQIVIAKQIAHLPQGKLFTSCNLKKGLYNFVNEKTYKSSAAFLAFLNQNKGQAHLNRPCLRLWKQDNSASWSFHLVDFIKQAKLLVSAYNCFTAAVYILVSEVTKICLWLKEGPEVRPT